MTTPALTADRIIRSSIAFAPESEKFFTKAVKSFFGVKPYFKEQIEEMLNCEVPIYFARHHYSHAASGVFPPRRSIKPPYSASTVLANGPPRVWVWATAES